MLPTLDAVLRHLRKLAEAQAARDLSDGELLDRFRSRREEAAFTILVQRHGPMVLGVCRRVLFNLHDAEDAFQATFLVLATQARSIRKRDSLGSWLHGVAQRVALKARARTATRRAHESGSIAMPHSEPLDDLTWQELRTILDEELSRLPEKYRAPLVLCYLEGKTNEEAARELGCPKSSLSWRLGRARELLRQRLSRRGLALSTGALATVLIGQTASAGVPASLAIAAVNAAVQFAAGGAVSAKVLALTQTTVKAMGLHKIKLAVVLAVGLAAGVGGVVSFQARTDGPAAVAEEQPNKEAERAPRKSVPPRTDPLDDPLPEGAVVRLGTVRFNHGFTPEVLLFSKDGRTILTEVGGTLRIWDADTGKELDSFATAKDAYWRLVVMRADGKKLVFLNQQDSAGVALRVFDLAQKEEVYRLTWPRPDSRRFGACANALSPDAKMAAVSVEVDRGSGKDLNLKIYSVETGRELYTLAKPPKTSEFYQILFTGKNQLVAVGQRNINVWEARTGDRVREFPHGGADKLAARGYWSAAALAASPDGKRLAILELIGKEWNKPTESDVAIWDLSTGTKKRVLLPPPKRSLTHLTFSPDGRQIIGLTATDDFDQHRRPRGWTIWDTETGERLRAGGDSYISAFALSPDGNRLALAGVPFQIWDVRSGKRIWDGSEFSVPAARAFFSPAGDRLITLASSLSKWDAVTGKQLDSCDLPPFPPMDSCQTTNSADGRYALTFAVDGENSQVIVWDVAAGKKLHAFRVPGQDQLLCTGAFSPDASLLAILETGKEPTIRIRELGSGRELRAIKLAKNTIFESLNPTKLYFAGDCKTLFLAGAQMLGFNVATGQELFSWKMTAITKEPKQNGIAWRVNSVSQDGSLALCVLSGYDRNREASGARLALCDARTGKVLRRWHEADFSFGGDATVFSPDGKLLATSERDVIHLWETATSKEIRAFRGHRNGITSLAFSPNGQRLVSTSYDHTVFIWDVTH